MFLELCNIFPEFRSDIWHLHTCIANYCTKTVGIGAEPALDGTLSGNLRACVGVRPPVRLILVGLLLLIGLLRRRYRTSVSQESEEEDNDSEATETPKARKSRGPTASAKPPREQPAETNSMPTSEEVSPSHTHSDRVELVPSRASLSPDWAIRCVIMYRLAAADARLSRSSGRICRSDGLCCSVPNVCPCLGSCR